MTTVLQVADSVHAQLNAAEFDFEFVAERVRSQLRSRRHEGNASNCCTQGRGALALDRAHNKYHCRVDVAVQKKFSKGTNAEIDPLVDLVEKIADQFRLKRLASFQAARCVKAEHAVLYSSEHWEQLRQFTSLLTLTFELAR